MFTKIYAIIPTGSRPLEYSNVLNWCDKNNITSITIATSDQAKQYSKGITIESNDLNISKWWNMGLDLAKSQNADIALILNDDVILPDNWLDQITEQLSKGYSGVSGNRQSSNSKIAGYAFGLNLKDNIRADENLVWWYGDDDIQKQCEAKNGFYIIPGLNVKNLYAFSTNHTFREQINKDSDYFYRKYMIDVTVVVATHGSNEWKEMGDIALESAIKTGAKTVRVHLDNGTLAEARNKALEKVDSEYVVFLDADDDLDSNYFIDLEPTDVTVTSISYPGRVPRIPKVWRHDAKHLGDCTAECLIEGNWVHIGAVIRTKLIKDIGGFKEYPVYEDWALFLSLQQKDAVFSIHPKSIYKASVRQSPGHRNSSMPIAERNKVHEQIYEDIIGLKYEH